MAVLDWAEHAGRQTQGSPQRPAQPQAAGVIAEGQDGRGPGDGAGGADGGVPSVAGALICRDGCQVLPAQWRRRACRRVAPSMDSPTGWGSGRIRNLAADGPDEPRLTPQSIGRAPKTGRLVRNPAPEGPDPGAVFGPQPAVFGPGGRFSRPSACDFWAGGEVVLRPQPAPASVTPPRPASLPAM